MLLGVSAGALDQASQAQLLLAVQAHLSSLGVIVELIEVEDSLDGAAAMDLATANSSLCVAWLSPEVLQLFLVTPALGQEVHVRDLPGDDDGWLSRCDLVATVLHSEVGALLGPGVFVVPTGEPEIPDPGPPARKSLASAVVLSARWAPFIPSSEGPFLQGAAVGVGLELGRRVTIAASVGMVQPTPLELGDARVARWPARISVALLLPRGNLELELELGVLLDTWKVLDLGYTTAEAESTDARFDAAVAPAGRVRYRVTPWLAPFVEVGADIYFQRRVYTLGDRTLLARDPALLRLGVGVAFLLELP